jgi:hypothetical protein
MVKVCHNRRMCCWQSNPGPSQYVAGATRHYTMWCAGQSQCLPTTSKFKISQFCTLSFYASCNGHLPTSTKRLVFVTKICCVLWNGVRAFEHIILINFVLQINEEQIAEFKLLSHATCWGSCYKHKKLLPVRRQRRKSTWVLNVSQVKRRPMYHCRDITDLNAVRTWVQTRQRQWTMYCIYVLY